MWAIPRARAALERLLVGVVIGLGALSASDDVFAQAARGRGVRERAQEAWSRGDFDTAETLYNEALQSGGLGRTDTLDVYVHLGATRAVLGKKDPALIAFRQAALIDPAFKTPPEAGKKASALADSAKKQQATLGKLELLPTFPKRVPAGKTFDVPVKMDPTFATVLAKVAISVTDRLSDRTYTSDQPAGAEMSFMVPGKLVTGETGLSVRLVGLDSRDNEMVAAEGRIAVEGGKALASPAAGGEPPRDKVPSKPFMQTPWPYILGGVALVAGGGALYYFVLRPADEIAVTGIRVQ